jgi:hypothetical protein
LEQKDATDAAGKVYAEKLRSLDVKQRIYAEKLISEVFFEAQLGTGTSRECSFAGNPERYAK